MIHNVSTQWLAHIMAAKGAGNPIELMGSLSDTLNLIYLNKSAGVQGCNSASTVISSVIGNIQFWRISAKVNR